MVTARHAEQGHLVAPGTQPVGEHTAQLTRAEVELVAFQDVQDGVAHRGHERIGDMRGEE